MHAKNYYRGIKYSDNEFVEGYLVYLNRKTPCIIFVFDRDNPETLNVKFEIVKEETLCRYVCEDNKGDYVYEKDFLKVDNRNYLYFVESYDKFIRDNCDECAEGELNSHHIRVVGNILQPIKKIENI